jgi:dipeptidase D
MNEVRNLEPSVLWNHFEDLNLVPRGSKKEERVIEFILAFGKSLGLPTERDAIGNVVIRKPATPGMENRKITVLQSHLDMVHQKNSDTVFNFDTDPIQSYIDGDWVKAKGTTLGADNGIGVAALMSVLSADDLEHGPIEALFTIDEETGMTGAFNLEPGFLKGSILLNLDTEDEHELTIGCAGGIDTTVHWSADVDSTEGFSAFQINIKGLAGGHSGVDIDLQRANSNKLAARFLSSLPKDMQLRLAAFEGGNLRNAIPREASGLILISEGTENSFEAALRQFKLEASLEFKHTDPLLTFTASRVSTPPTAISSNNSSRLVNALNAAPNGVYRMSSDIPGLVETSTNLSKVVFLEGKLVVHFLTRSSVETSKMDLCGKIESVFNLLGASIDHSGGYPGWAPNPESEILEIVKAVHQTYFGSEAIVNAIHAGLECGIIGRSHPGLDMISFGPTIKNPHSPDEKVEIATVQRFWEFLKLILRDVPMA